MTCKNCGAEIKESLKFCNKCGAKIELFQLEEVVNEIAPAVSETTANAPINEVSNSGPESKHKSVGNASTELQNKDGSSVETSEKPRKEPKDLDRSNPKSKVIAGVLALFLGILGIQWFYLKKPTRGAIYILITILGTFVVPGIVFIWELFLFGEAIFFFAAKGTTVEKYAQQAIRQKSDLQ